MSRQLKRVIDSSYPPVVMTVVGWAYLIGKGPDEVCLSFAIPEEKQGKTVGCCVNMMLPSDVVVDWSPKEANLHLFPKVSISDDVIDTSVDTLSRVEGRWSVVYARDTGGISVLEGGPD